MIINMTGGGSGGAALNFDVVRYATESELLAATQKANTIGIISTTEMTGWIVDPNQPENMTNGMVWISVGTKSTVEFNALKKNALQVYPLEAKQMVSGALVNKPAMIYQNGEWVKLANIIVPNDKYIWECLSHKSVTRNDDGTITIVAGTTGNNHGASCIDSIFDVSNYKTLKVTYSITNTTNSHTKVGFFTDKTSPYTSFICYFATHNYAANTKVTVSIPIEGVDVPVYFGTALYDQTMTIYGLELE